MFDENFPASLSAAGRRRRESILAAALVEACRRKTRRRTLRLAAGGGGLALLFATIAFISAHGRSPATPEIVIEPPQTPPTQVAPPAPVLPKPVTVQAHPAEVTIA